MSHHINHTEKTMNRLLEMIERAYELGVQAQTGHIETALAEEVTAECGEFLALWEGLKSFYHDEESIDQELVALVNHLKGESK